MYLSLLKFIFLKISKDPIKLEHIDLWVKITPFGIPLVPDV